MTGVIGPPKMHIKFRVERTGSSYDIGVVLLLKLFTCYVSAYDVTPEEISSSFIICVMIAYFLRSIHHFH